MPRFLMILMNKEIPLNLKEHGCEVLIEILSLLDRNFLRDNILKCLQSLRDSINEPTICMHILTLYEGIASTLTPEDIGNTILPGLIPMLISASFTKSQFNKLVSTIRTLIDQLEKHRLKDLSEMDPLNDADNKTSNQKDIFTGLSDDPFSALPPQENEGDFDFLSQIEGTKKLQTPKKSNLDTMHSKGPSNNDPFSGISSSSTQSAVKPAKNDIFAGISSGVPNTSSQGNSDPFGFSKPAPQKSSNSGFGGGIGLAPPKSSSNSKKDPFADMDPFGSNPDPFSTSQPNKPSNDPFSGFGQGSGSYQAATGIATPSINMSTGFKSLDGGADPFADAFVEESKSSDNNFGGSNLGSGLGSGFDSGFGFQQKKPDPPKNTSSSGSNPFAGLGGPTKTNSGASKPSTSNFGMGGGTQSSSNAFGGQNQNTFNSNSSQNSFSSGTNQPSFNSGGNTFGEGSQNTGMGFPSNIDMNAPMDQNTMNMMMSMMNNFQQQMNPPAWGNQQNTNNQSSGQGNNFNSKGLFD